jgi:hypothetical protein
MAITQLKQVDKLISQIGDINLFTQFADNKGLPIYNNNNQILMSENTLNFQILREFLEWEFTKKVTALSQLFQESPQKTDVLTQLVQETPISVQKTEPILYRKPPKFTPLKTYRETALQAILLQGDKKNQLCADIRNQTDQAIGYITRISTIYSEPSKSFRGLKEAFRAIAMESESEDFDWDEG